MRWNLAALAVLGVASILTGCTTTAPPPVTTQAASLPPDPPPPFAWPAAAAKTSDPMPVTVAALGFAWPKDVQAQESIAETGTVAVTGKPPKTAAKSYTIMMTAAPVAEGVRISYSDMQVEMPNLTEHARALINASIEPMTAVRFPPFLVTPRGKFLRVDNIDQVVADAKSLAEAAKQQKANSLDSTVNVSMGTPQDITAESVSSSIAFGWNMLVGYWSESTLTSGRQYPIHLTGTQSAANPAGTVTYDGLASYAGRVACDAGEIPDGCVALTIQIRADPAELKSWMQQHMSVSAATGAHVLDLDSASKDITLRLVAEPDTLLPRRMQWVDDGTLQFGLLTPVKARIDMLQRSELVTSFHYVKR